MLVEDCLEGQGAFCAGVTLQKELPVCVVSATMEGASTAETRFLIYAHKSCPPDFLAQVIHSVEPTSQETCPSEG
jgi:hypothetical protein